MELVFFLFFFFFLFFPFSSSSSSFLLSCKSFCLSLLARLFLFLPFFPLPLLSLPPLLLYFSTSLRLCVFFACLLLLATLLPTRFAPHPPNSLTSLDRAFVLPYDRYEDLVSCRAKEKKKKKKKSRGFLLGRLSSPGSPLPPSSVFFSRYMLLLPPLPPSPR